MSVFRFRAQAALDMRRRELQTAQGHLSRAEQVREMAARGAEKAAATLAEGQQTAADGATATRSVTELQWYRFWIVRLDHERRSAQLLLAAAESDVAKMSAACLYARQRCESLERLREKMRRSYDRAEADAERKVIDEIATLRFNIDRRAAGL
jgi:flagellar export protein FliJ